MTQLVIPAKAGIQSFYIQRYSNITPNISTYHTKLF